MIAHKVAEWSMQNRVQLNNDKCKELEISFVKGEPHFAPIAADGYELKRVSGHIKQSHMKQAYSDVIKSVKVPVFFSAVKKIKSSSAGHVHFLYCLYILCCYVSGTCLFLCPAKVPKRRVVVSWKAGNVYNIPRTALPGGYQSGEHCPYCRFHRRDL